MNPDVLAAIPHRPPFLFLDEIAECTPELAVGLRTLRANEPHYAGHYPGNPITPGVLLCEACFQTAAYYLVKHPPDGLVPGPELTPVLSRIEVAKFKRMAKPGETLRIEVRRRESKAGFHFLSGKVTSAGKTVLTCDFVLALLPPGAEA